MNLDNNRLLLLLEQSLRDINREIINPEFEKLKIDDLKPVINLAARARVDYLKELFEISNEFPSSLPPVDRITILKEHRVRYEELVSASQALETAIERNYLDVMT